MPGEDPQWIVVTDPDGQEHRFPASEYTQTQAIQEVRRARGERISSGVFGDLGPLLTSGIGALESSIGGGLDFIGLDAVGRPFQEAGDRLQRRASTRFSPELARDLDLPGIQAGDVYSTLAQSAPSTATIMLPSIGLGAFAGTRAIARPFGAALEGIQSAGGATQTIEDSIRNYAIQNPEEFAASEVGQEALRASGGDFGQAVEIAAERANGFMPALIGAGVGAIGLRGIDPADLFKTQAGSRMASNILLNPIRAGIAEGIEELGQSGIEQFGTNLSVGGVDPNVGMFDQVPEAMGLGAIAGGIGGGIFGTAQSTMDILQGRRDPRIEDNQGIDPGRQTVESAYDQAEAMPSPPPVTPPIEPTVRPETKPDQPVEQAQSAAASDLQEYIDTLALAAEEGDQEETIVAASDLANAMAAAGVPEDRIMEAASGGADGLLALARDIGGSEPGPALTPGDAASGRSEAQASVAQPRSEVNPETVREMQAARDNLRTATDAMVAEQDAREQPDNIAGANDPTLNALAEQFRAREEMLAGEEIADQDAYDDNLAAMLSLSSAAFGPEYTARLDQRFKEDPLAAENEYANDVEQLLVRYGQLTAADIKPETQEVAQTEPAGAGTEATQERPLAPETRDSSAVERGIHSPEVEGSSPSPAPNTADIVPQLTTPEQNYDPDDLDQFNERARSIPLDQLKAASEQVKPSQDAAGRPMFANREQEDAFRTLRDAISAHRGQKKAATPVTTPNAPPPRRPEPAGSIQPPKATKPVEPEPEPEVKGVSVAVQRRLQKAAGRMKDTENYHPNSLSALLSAVNDGREELGENRIGPATRTPSGFKNRAEWLVSEANRLIGADVPAPRKGAVFTEDLIRDALAEKDLAATSPLRSETETGEARTQEQLEALDKSTRKPRKKKGPAEPAPEVALSKEGQEETTPRGTGEPPPPAITEAAPAVGEVSDRAASAQEEASETETPAQAKNVERPSENFDTPTASDLKLIDRMEDAGGGGRAAAAQRQGYLAAQIGEERGFDAMVDAINAIEGVFNRARAASFASSLLPDEQKRELSERIYGLQAVKDYLNESGENLWTGLYMATQRGRNNILNSGLGQASMEEHAELQAWRRAVRNARREGRNITWQTWTPPVTTGIQTNDDRQFKYEFLRNAALPALNRIRSLEGVNQRDLTDQRRQSIEQHYNQVFRTVMEIINNDLTYEMRAELLNRENGWLQQQVEMGRFMARTADDVFAGASSNIWTHSDWRRFSGRESGPTPVYNLEGNERKAALGRRLNQYLEQMGLSDIKGRIVNNIIDIKTLAPIEDASAAYTSKLLLIAMGGDEFTDGRSLNDMSLDEAWKHVKYRADHELVHAMRQLGLLKPGEWRTLRQAAYRFGLDEDGNIVRTDNLEQSFRGQISSDPLYQKMMLRYTPSEANIIADEEAVAMMWQNMMKLPPSRPKTIFARLSKIMRAIMRALRAASITDPEQLYTNAKDIIGHMQDGKIGQRNRNYMLGLDTSAAAIVDRMRAKGGVFQSKRWHKLLKAAPGPDKKRAMGDPHGWRHIIGAQNRAAFELIKAAEQVITYERALEEFDLIEDMLTEPDMATLQTLYAELADAKVDVERIINILGDDFWNDQNLMSMYLAVKTYKKTFAEITPDELAQMERHVYGDGKDVPPYLFMSRGVKVPKKLDDFLKSDKRNTHIEVDRYNLYIRKSERLIAGATYNMLDLATVERDSIPTVDDFIKLTEKLPPEQRRPRGRFRELMQTLEQAARANGLDGVYVENIINKFLPDVLESYGYTREDSMFSLDTPSYYRVWNGGQLFMSRARTGQKVRWSKYPFGRPVSREYEINPLQMYSAAERAATEFPESRSTRIRMVNYIRRRAKKDELQFLALDEFLRAGENSRQNDKATRQELVQWIRDRKIRMSVTYYYGKMRDKAAGFAGFTRDPKLHEYGYSLTATFPNYTLLGASESIARNYMEVAGKLMAPAPGYNINKSHFGGPGTIWGALVNDLEIPDVAERAFFVNQGQSDMTDVEDHQWVDELPTTEDIERLQHKAVEAEERLVDAIQNLPKPFANKRNDRSTIWYTHPGGEVHSLYLNGGDFEGGNPTRADVRRHLELGALNARLQAGAMQIEESFGDRWDTYGQRDENGNRPPGAFSAPGVEDAIGLLHDPAAFSPRRRAMPADQFEQIPYEYGPTEETLDEYFEVIDDIFVKEIDRFNSSETFGDETEQERSQYIVYAEEVRGLIKDLHKRLKEPFDILPDSVDVEPLLNVLRLNNERTAAVKRFHQARHSDLRPSNLPFRNTWPEAMFRHLFMMAISGGNDAFAWATADTIRSYPGHSTYKGDFYDKRWPAYARGWLKQFGAEVKKIEYRIGNTPLGEERDNDSYWDFELDGRLSDEMGELVSSYAQINSANDYDVYSYLHDHYSEMNRDLFGRYRREVQDREAEARRLIQENNRALEEFYRQDFNQDEEPALTLEDQRRIDAEFIRDWIDRYWTVDADVLSERSEYEANREEESTSSKGITKTIWVMPITPEMRSYFLDRGAQMFMSGRKPHSVKAADTSSYWSSARRQDRRDVFGGVAPATAAGFGIARKPGATFLGAQPRDVVRRIIMNTTRDPQHWSKRTAAALTTKLADVGRGLEKKSINFSLGQGLGKAIRHFAYGMTTLGNLPGQGWYLTLRSKLMGDIAAGVDHAERLNKLAERMSETDFEQFGKYMLTRDADVNEISNPDVREAARLSKQLFEQFGVENVRLGRLDEKQFAKYSGRYLPRKYFRYIENSLRTTGIRLGTQGYTRERLPGQDRQIFGAADLAGKTVRIEELRTRVTELLKKTSKADQTRAGMFLSHKLKTTKTIADGVLKRELPAIRNELAAIEKLLDSMDLISLKVEFPRVGEEAAYGPHILKKRYGEHYLARAFHRAAQKGNSIGNVLEQSAIDAQITDPVVLAATGIAEQNRDLAVVHFFTAINEFDRSLEDVAPDAKRLNWVPPDQLIPYQGRLLTADALLQQLNDARENFHLIQSDLLKRYAEKQIAEMQALIDEYKIDDSKLGEEYVRLPTTEAYGDLRGLIVHRAIYNDLKGTLGMRSGVEESVRNAYDKSLGGFMSFFKQAMTTLNIPKGHARAIFQNVATSYLSGVGGHDVGLLMPSFNLQTWSWYFRTLGMMQASASGEVNGKDLYGKEFNHREYGDLWRLAQDLGVRHGTFTTTELRHAHGLIRKLKINERMASGDKTAQLQAVLDFMEGAKGVAADMFNFWDTWARFTKFVHEVESKGASPEDAMIEANEWAPDYSLVPDWVRATRSTVVPFLCVDSETEILTQRGWLKYDEVTIGDIAASYNQQTLKMEWKPITDVYRNHKSGEMVRIKNRHLDMLTTPDHRLVVHAGVGTKFERVKIVEAQNLRRNHQIPTAADFDHRPTGEPLSDDMVELIGWYVTEGTPHPKCDGLIISQNAGPKADMIEALLRRMDGLGNVQEHQHGGSLETQRKFYVPVRLGREVRALCPDKHLTPSILMRMTVEQIRRLVGVMILGDGSIDKNERACFVQNPGPTLDTFQMALTIIGKSYGVYQHGERSKIVTIREGRNYRPLRNPESMQKVDYDGTIWCPEVADNHTWFARRGGSVWVSHNTFRYKLTPKFIDLISKGLGHAERGEVKDAADTFLRLSAPIALWAGVTSQIAAAMLGMDDDEHKSFRAAMSRYFRNNVGTIPVPLRDSQGNFVLVDLGIMFPWTQTVQSGIELAQGNTEGFLQQSGVGIPAADVWAAWSTGIDPYSGFPLYAETATPAEKNVAFIAYLINYLTPPGFRGLVDPLINALMGQEAQMGSGEIARTLDATFGDGLSMSGKPIEDAPYLAGRFLTGFNFNAFDPLDQIRRNRSELNRKVTAIEEERRATIRNHNRLVREINAREGISESRRKALLERRRRSFDLTLRRLRERQRRAFEERNRYGEQVRDIQEFENERLED